MPTPIDTLQTDSPIESKAGTQGAQNASVDSIGSAPATTLSDPSLASLFSSLAPTERLLALQAAASVLSGRFQFSSLTGYGFQSFEGLRDFFTALGFTRELTISEYRDRYKRGGIASTLVNLLPDEMWDDGVTIREIDYDPESPSEYETQSADIWKRLNIESRLMKADKLAGLGLYSVVLIGVKLKPNEKLSDPLSTNLGPNSVIYLLQYAQDNAKVISLVQDPSSERFGQPEYYEINTIATPPAGSALLPTQNNLSPIKVHWTRIIHVAHGLLESDWIGTPDLESSWNDLDSLYKVAWGGPEAAWRNMDRGVQWDLDPEYDHTSDEAKALLTAMKSEIKDMRHNLEKDVFTSGVTAKPLNVQTDKYGSNIEAITKLVGGTHRIPYTLLLGEELGLRAGESNRDNLDIMTGSRRKQFGDPLVRQLQDRFIACGIVVKPRSSDYAVIWGTEEELTEEKKAELVKTLAQANQAQSAAGGGLVYTSNDIRDKAGDEPIPDDKLADYNLEDAEEEEKVIAPVEPDSEPVPVEPADNVIPFAERELR